MQVVIDKDGHVDPAGAADLVGTFRHAWTDDTQYRIFYCLGCRQPFNATVGEKTVHDCPSEGRALALRVGGPRRLRYA
ncbi:MAG: hypothetical protein WED85_07865 [Dehalococcoidia bacterium]